MLDRPVADDLPQAIWRVDRQGRMVYANSAYLAMHGVTLAEILGRTVAQWSTLPDAPRYLALELRLMEACSTETTIDDVVDLLSGQRRYFDVSRTPICDAQGQVIGLQGVFWDVTERRMLEEGLELMARVSTEPGQDDFLRRLVRHLALALGSNFVCVDRVDATLGHARTLAVFRDGGFADNFEYALRDTPCGSSVGKDVCVYSRGVQALFPRHQLLVDLAAESYIGVTLWGRGGEPIGLIAATSRQPIGHMGRAENLLRLLAVRAAAEIERVDVEAALRESHQALSARTNQLELTLNSITQGVAMKDAADRMVFQSRRAMELLELPDTLMRASHTEIVEFQARRGDFGPEFSLVEPRARDYVRLHGSGGQPVVNSYTRRTPAGRTLEVRTIPLPDGAWVRTYADVTDYVQAIADRSASEALWKFALEGSGDGVWDWDPVRHTGRFSGLYKTLLGYRADMPDAEMPPWESRLHPEDRERVEAALTAHYAGRSGAFMSEHRLRCRDGSYKWFLERGMVVSHGPDGTALRTVGTMSDISERKQAENKLSLAASVFTHTMEGIVITDPSGVIVEVNEAFSRISGYSREDALGQTPRILNSGLQDAGFYAAMWQRLLQEGHWSGEIWNRRKTGEVYAEILTISAVRNPAGKTVQYVALFTDITAHKEHERQLEHIAHYDALTGLPNRVLLGDRLQQAMVRCNRQECSLAVAFLDLDGFKAINDAHGHDVGDAFLIAIGQRMKSMLREGDSLARIGGDEFVAVLVDLDPPESCEPVLQRLLRAASEPVHCAGHSLRVSASIGVTIYPQDGVEPDLLMRHADQAMYLAKQAGKNRFHLFDLAHDFAAKTQRETLAQLQLAFELQQFALYYQPKVHMRSGKVIGAEALIRWQDPERGTLPPGAFLPVMEGHVLSLQVGDWVIASALSQMARWKAEGLELPVSVNIGARQLQQQGFAARLAEMLAAHPQIPPHCLELEILETSALEDITKVSEVMKACKALGVRFALDDFGTGYSSLTYLKRLPADMIKIDQSFVRDMLDDTEDRAIVEGVVGLARVFRREVIAEGVETLAHGSQLLQLGCELAQGYGIARPMPADRMPQWVASWCAAPDWSAQPPLATPAATGSAVPTR